MAIRYVPRNESSRSLVTSYGEAGDEQLMMMFQADDFRAFETLIDRYKGLIWRVVKQYLGSVSEVEDITQEISLSLFQRREAWKPGQAKFSTWLYRVPANRCIDVIREKREKSADDSSVGEGVPSGILSAEDNVSQKQVSEHLLKILDELPRQQRMALTLYYYEDVPVNQIASRLDVSELAARSLIKRGKQKLREVADPYLVF